MQCHGRKRCHLDIQSIVSDSGKVDVLVIAAGIAHIVAAEDHDFNRWHRTMDVNLDGSFLFAREAGMHMLAEKIKGSIILIANMSASLCVRPQKQAAYNASKGGIQMLAKSLVTDWAPRGIRVNSLSPGVNITQLLPNHTDPHSIWLQTWLEVCWNWPGRWPLHGLTVYLWVASESRTSYKVPSSGWQVTPAAILRVAMLFSTEATLRSNLQYASSDIDSVPR